MPNTPVAFSKTFTAPPQVREKALRWAAQQYTTCCYLTSNGYEQTMPYNSVNTVLAVGALNAVVVDEASQDSDPFAALQQAWKQSPGWWFGGLAYDLKNAVEALSSAHADGIGLPDLYFFQPLHLIHFSAETVRIESQTLAAEDIWEDICATTLPSEVHFPIANISSRFSKEEYLSTVARIKEHIIAGDIYEMNFCQEFFVENYNLNDPVALFEQLNQQAKAPFAGFVKLKDRYLCCASPERFLQKKGQQLRSQPIKGTAPRHTDPVQDAAQKMTLYHSEKDRAENVMIVDLVRNDLAKNCKPGSVKVEELFGIYGFPQVYQMISTITGTLRPKVPFTQAIRDAFPMGSMTGAPKVMSMQLIEQYERSRRGWYSGAIGYISPSGDFDFNVVIRSLLFNAASRYLSFQVGGAIVYDSVPEAEYEECLLKAKGILKTIGS